jgi:predicted phosphoribosyltransferase
MFKNRQEAGKKLGKALQSDFGSDVLVLAIPREGVAIGYEVQKMLHSDFSLIIVQELPLPDTPEARFGAISEDGSTILMEITHRWLEADQIKKVIEEQQAEIERRIEILRNGQPLPEITGRKVILVDEGIATGFKMRAAIKCCKKKDPKKIVVAAPVAGPETGRSLRIMKNVDQTVILRKPRFFRTVAQVYENWYDVPDHEVLKIMKRWKQEQR